MQFTERKIGGNVVDNVWISKFVDGVGYQIQKNEDGTYIVDRLTWVPDTKSKGGMHERTPIAVVINFADAKEAAEEHWQLTS